MTLPLLKFAFVRQSSRRRNCKTEREPVVNNSKGIEEKESLGRMFPYDIFELLTKIPFPLLLDPNILTG